MTQATAPRVEDLMLSVTEEIHVKAPLKTTFDALIEELTNMIANENRPMPMKIEQWPGGRWYRDLGDGNGHIWAHVQAIKKPTLLELYGPLMMSYPVMSNVQYRLSEEAGGTLIKFQHLALGVIPDDYKKGIRTGWGSIHSRTKSRAEGASSGKVQ